MASLLLLLTLSLGAVSADKLLYAVQQQPPLSEGFVTCPDQNSRCSSTATCCQLSSGQWGCCPFAKASCCEDQQHCCPQGYSCNAKKGHCVKAVNNDTIPWAEKQMAAAVATEEPGFTANAGIVCANGARCPDKAACCRTFYGDFTCCTYPNNVCCSDGHRCCPRSTICDMINNKCLPGFATADWKPLTASVPAIDLPLK